MVWDLYLSKSTMRRPKFGRNVGARNRENHWFISSNRGIGLGSASMAASATPHPATYNPRAPTHTLSSQVPLQPLSLKSLTPYLNGWGGQAGPRSSSELKVIVSLLGGRYIVLLGLGNITCWQCGSARTTIYSADLISLALA